MKDLEFMERIEIKLYVEQPSIFLKEFDTFNNALNHLLLDKVRNNPCFKSPLVFIFGSGPTPSLGHYFTTSGLFHLFIISLNYLLYY